MKQYCVFFVGVFQHMCCFYCLSVYVVQVQQVNGAIGYESHCVIALDSSSGWHCILALAS